MFNENYLFEVCWEVCNKVGGIHTVITSKIPEVRKNFKNYYLVGPYLNKNYSGEFEEVEIPSNFKNTVLELEKSNIKLHFGKWLDYENQEVILVEYLGFRDNINFIKEKLWENFKIDSMGSNWYDFDEAILWSWVCGVAIEKLSLDFEKKENDVIVHSHEWMSGGAIFYFKQFDDKKYSRKFKTIFTTHATMLGRSISSNTGKFYDGIETIDADKRSHELGMHTKHQTERALANFSDCFTTVSQITNTEARNFYLKSADVLLPNGFENFSGIDDFKNSRSDLFKFLSKYSKNFENLNDENSLIYYTSGRNEFKDKGMDIYIKSLGKLNSQLKSNDLIKSKEIINLFLIPIGDFKLAENDSSSLVTPFSTHDICGDNEFIKAFLENGLLNTPEDNVKVILIPMYIDKKDGIFNKNYYNLINGCDLGIFPSLYEPWGYTPMESIAYYVPTITSDLAGFGKYINSNFNKENIECVKVLNREFDDDERAVSQLTNLILDSSRKNNFELKTLRKQSFELSKNFSWKNFYINYLKAYELAIQKK